MISGYFILFRIIAYYFVLFHIASYYFIFQIISNFIFHIISYYFVLFHIISNYFVLFRVILYYFELFRIISYYFLFHVSYNFILFRISSYFITQSRGLVVRASGYKPRGPGFDSRLYHGDFPCGGRIPVVTLVWVVGRIRFKVETSLTRSHTSINS